MKKIIYTSQLILTVTPGLQFWTDGRVEVWTIRHLKKDRAGHEREEVQVLGEGTWIFDEDLEPHRVK